MWNIQVLLDNNNQLPESCRCTTGRDCVRFDLDINGTIASQTAYERV